MLCSVSLLAAGDDWPSGHLPGLQMFHLRLCLQFYMAFPLGLPTALSACLSLCSNLPFFCGHQSYWLKTLFNDVIFVVWSDHFLEWSHAELLGIRTTAYVYSVCVCVGWGRGGYFNSEHVVLVAVLGCGSQKLPGSLDWRWDNPMAIGLSVISQIKSHTPNSLAFLSWEHILGNFPHGKEQIWDCPSEHYAWMGCWKLSVVLPWQFGSQMTEYYLTSGRENLMTIWQYILETSCRLNTGMDKNLRTVSLHDSVILLGDVS